MIEREGQRPDQTHKLGTELTPKERECYYHICQNGDEPISKKEIYNRMYGYPDMPKLNYSRNSNINSLIYRIRDKFGKKSIISCKDQGFIARTELIKYKVVNNLYDNKQDKKNHKVQVTIKKRNQIKRCPSP